MFFVLNYITKFTDTYTHHKFPNLTPSHNTHGARILTDSKSNLRGMICVCIFFTKYTHAHSITHIS